MEKLLLLVVISVCLTGCCVSSAVVEGETTHSGYIIMLILSLAVHVDAYSLQKRDTEENSTEVTPYSRKGEKGETGATGPQGPPGPRSGGVTYVRWGRTTCPDTEGTELVYTGRAAGSFFDHRGGGGNYQCIVEDPENFAFGAGTVDASYMYGAEYEMGGNVPSSSLPLHNHDVPCVVCYVSERETSRGSRKVHLSTEMDT